MKKENILLDLTTVITCVSDICLDPDIENRFGDPSEWERVNKDIHRQIKDEKEDPIYEKLIGIVKNNNAFITQETEDKLLEIINYLGSDSERSNMYDLLKSITVIKDDPSERILSLGGKNWSSLNKNIFGTCDKLNFKIVTGNIKALSYLLNEEGIELDYIAHRTRCFVGNKYEVVKN